MKPIYKSKEQNKRIEELHFDKDIEDDIVAFDKQSLFKPLPIESCSILLVFYNYSKKNNYYTRLTKIIVQ